MAGIYLHIPFCKQACHYCDFHFSTSMSNRDELIGAMAKELEARVAYLAGQEISTVYFGGGTPSLLSKKELDFLFHALHKNFSIRSDAEITLEANPDDLNPEKLSEWHALGINRLSIGIQSFRDEDLKSMNRAHTSKEAEVCVKLAKEAGFKSLSLDLIYGIPGLSNEAWLMNLQKADALNCDHLSCYSLTVEKGTPLEHRIKKGVQRNVNDAESAAHFAILMDWARRAQFVHYEISNFCRGEFFSKHNTAYWKGAHYIGIGPSAHSFNGISRQWNLSSNAHYTNALNSQKSYFEMEVLTKESLYNEFILTGLRTMWGCSISSIQSEFGEAFKLHFLKEAKEFLDKKWLVQEGDVFTLSDEGKFYADAIASTLFILPINENTNQNK